MSEEIGASRPGESGTTSSPTMRRFVPVRVGQATVYIEEKANLIDVEPGDDIHPVALTSPQDVLANAGAVIKECVRSVGDHISRLAAEIRPQEVSVEFALTFAVHGKTSIPVFVTGESSAQTGLTIKAVWKNPRPETGPLVSKSAQGD
jgi:hypothetical protein